MALPQIDTPRDEGQIQEIVKDIATAVFKSAKISMENAAKAVVPSVPEMVDEVLDDLKSGSVRTFNLALDKLDKIVQQLGIDLRDYSKELADFQQNRQEKITKSEEKIQTLREKNIVAMIEKSGDIKVLSKREIELRQQNLRTVERDIKREEKQLEKERKLLQESNRLNTNSVKKTREDIENRTQYIKELQLKRQEEIEVLGERSEEQPGIFQRAREGVGNFVDEYVPTPIAEVGQQIVEGLTAPITIIKDLATTFGGLLKPLKLLKPLFTGLVAGLKRFMVGLAASVISFLPFIAIGAAIVLAITGVIMAINKFKNALGFGDEEEDKKKGTGKYQSLDEGTYDVFNEGMDTGTNDTIVPNKSSNVIPMNEPKGKMNLYNFKNTTPKINPEQLKPANEMIASAGNYTAVNSPQTVVNRTSNSLSSGISGVSNKDAWYNTATA